MFEINKKLSDAKCAYLMNPEKRNDHAKPKLILQVRTELRVNQYSKIIEEAYIGWIKRFILFPNKRHPTGHSSVKTTMIYTHVLNKGLGVKSPLD